MEKVEKQLMLQLLNKVIDKGSRRHNVGYDFLVLKIKMPSDLSLFLGSLAGATAVKISVIVVLLKRRFNKKIQFSIK